MEEKGMQRKVFVLKYRQFLFCGQPEAREYQKGGERERGN